MKFFATSSVSIRRFACGVAVIERKQCLFNLFFKVSIAKYVGLFFPFFTRELSEASSPSSSIINVALSEFEPITTLSGFKKSSTALPCFKNSGFYTTSNGYDVCCLIISATLSAVPTGTVDLSTITL